MRKGKHECDYIAITEVRISTRLEWLPSGGHTRTGGLKAAPRNHGSFKEPLVRTRIHE
jgi:hypothetical protein